VFRDVRSKMPSMKLGSFESGLEPLVNCLPRSGTGTLRDLGRNKLLSVFGNFLIVSIYVIIDSGVIGDSLVDYLQGFPIGYLAEGDQFLGQLGHQELEVGMVGGGSQVYLVLLVVSRQGLVEVGYCLWPIHVIEQ